MTPEAILMMTDTDTIYAAKLTPDAWGEYDNDDHVIM